MRKGLTKTLMMVAIALVSVQAMAFAPVIGDMPSPVIGSNDGITGAQKFVFPDAMDLNVLAEDEYTPQADLMWTYSGSSLRYLINGVNPINVGTTDPTSPSLAQIINKTVAGGETNADSKANTITIRNKGLAPIGGAVTTPGTTGIVPAETQAVTFFCSDGNLFTSRTVFFYTDNGGVNRLSGGTIWKQEKTTKFTTGTDWWSKPKAEVWPTGAAGSVTTHTFNATGGMCLDASLTGTNMGSLLTPYAYFKLSANTIYRIKLTMNGTQASAGSTPLWDFILDNVDETGTNGGTMYAMDTLFYDNPGFGGANTVVNSTTGKDLTMYWAPNAVSTPQWNDAATGAFTATMDAKNDPVLHFRVMDVDSLGFGQNKSGAVCITNLVIESAPMSAVKTVTSKSNLATLAAAGTSGGNVVCQSMIAANHVTISFASGQLTITPTTTPVNVAGFGNVSGQQIEITELFPATDLDTQSGAPWTSYLDNWPIHWDTDKLLRMQMDLSAPDATSAAKPWDAIFMSWQAMDSELLMDTYMTSSYGCGAPKTGTAQTYHSFFFTNKESTTTESRYHQLRWYVRFMNHTTANFPSNSAADLLNTGGVKVHGIRVDEVRVSIN